MSTILPPTRLGWLPWNWTRTCIFGVINVTPDSFSDGGCYEDPARAVEHGLHLAEAGADVLDVGGESTRPGSQPVPEEEELRRVIPVVEALARRHVAPISVDTIKARVAREALAAGACIINDISGGLLDPGLLDAAVEGGATLVLGHLRGQPATMNEGIRFRDVTVEVQEELRAALRRAMAAGLPADRLWVDPGLGFGKTAPQTLQLLRTCGRLREATGHAVLVGPSRKSFIGAVTGQPVGERVMGTCAATAAAIIAGADAVRLHDVEMLAPAVRVADAIRRGA